MSFRNHKDFADAQGRIRDLSLVISRRPCFTPSLSYLQHFLHSFCCQSRTSLCKMRFDLDLSFGNTHKRSNWELLYPIVGALVALTVRNVCQKYIFTKIGVLLGLKQIQVKKPPHNPVLEKAYSTSKRWKLARVLVILILPNLVFRCRCGAWPSNSTCRWRKCRDGSS
jgi:hypothetical protein